MYLCNNQHMVNGSKRGVLTPRKRKGNKMEIGSFIELQLPGGHEYYQGKDVLRLNTGRAAIWHAFRLTGKETLWLPYYLCDSVRNYLKSKGVTLKYYHITPTLEPAADLQPKKDDAILLVNYFGIRSYAQMAAVMRGYDNPTIIDNSQAFFCPPVRGAYNIYSCRKFIGVPDGAYVIGDDAERFSEEYEQGYSSDTSLFLLERIEYGCDEVAYQHKLANDMRLDKEDVRLMSKLTHQILDATDYKTIIRKRKKNYDTACELFGWLNELQVGEISSEESIPMVYPLVMRNDDLPSRLKQIGHYQGPWWEYLLEEMEENSVEYWLSRYMIPITIDQRYGAKELEYIIKHI